MKDVVRRVFNLKNYKEMKANVWFDGVEYVAERNGVKGYGDSKQEAIARLERKEERERVRIELDNLLKR